MKKTKISLFFLFILSSITSYSQAENVTNGASKKFVTVEEISAFDFLSKGGVFLIPIAILFFYTIYLGVEKYVFIRRRTKNKLQDLSDIRTKLSNGNIDLILNDLDKNENSYTSVIKEGVLTIGRPVLEIESNMEKVTNIEIGKMEKGLGHLGLIAGIAPILGFIGTISGVIKIFYSISISENVSIGNISAGLYEKMISSGSGLVVGIIAFSAYHLLNAMIDAYVLHIQKINLDFVNIIQRPSHGDKAK